MDAPFFLFSKDIKCSLLVPKEELASLLNQKDQFEIHTASPSSSVPEPQSPAELCLQYLQYLLDGSTPSSNIRAILQALEQQLMGRAEIHTYLCSLSIDAALHGDFIATYYAAAARCDGMPARKSAFLAAAQAGDIEALAVFGGQGAANTMCMSELTELYRVYTPFLDDLINVAAPVLSRLCRLPETKRHFTGRCIDIDRWLQDPYTVPQKDFVATAAVSFPVIGILSLAHYCVSCKVLGKQPGDLRSVLRGLTGHSQGLVVAAGIALSDTWESFYVIATLIIDLLFWIGYESHHAAPRASVPAALVNESEDLGEGRPSCMLSIRGLQRSHVERLLTEHNRCLPCDQQVHLALENARDNFVVAGPADSLGHLNAHLRSIKADSTLDQDRVPFSKRKPTIHHQFLPVSAPFHTSYLESAATKIKQRVKSWSIQADKLTISVYDSETGDDLRALGSTNLVNVLIDAITTRTVHWPRTLRAASVSHIVVFGSGGIAELVKKITDGRGVRVIQGSSFTSRDPSMGCKSSLFSSHIPESSTKVPSWEEQFKPELTRSAAGKWVMKTKLSKLLNTPPVMVAGMTPTTVHWDFVAAIMNAGYHAELAGGGYYNAESMAEGIANLVAALPPGRGITCNIIYASPHSVSWQIALLRRLVRDGCPIDGLTIGAGVPSPEIVAEYIQSLKLKHLSLKPGSAAAIKQVIEIAKANPDTSIILQWTGGRGGGHHSFEDFHDPIVSTYGLIRKCPNLILVAGSGFGDSEDTYPYLTGSWAERFGVAPMPFDGILLGSRMMVARESHTSLPAKQLLCGAAGVPDAEWENTYTGSAGGYITVQSEMGQPIHKVANRGVLFWAEMDKMIFSLPQKDRIAKLEQNKDYIVKTLNADFAKPWFGRNSDGDAVDLSDMTYAETLQRLISLMYVEHQQRWIHSTYAKFVGRFAARTLERLPIESGSEMPTFDTHCPHESVERLLQDCPLAVTTPLNQEDVRFFLIQCKAKGQKPVNFVPVLNEDFEFYMKKDSLWQSEDIDAVVDGDAGRVCILHGPVAARHTVSLDESAKDILDGIVKGHIDMYRSERSTERNVETLETRSPSPRSVATPRSIGTPISSATSVTTPTSVDAPSDDDICASQSYFSSDRFTNCHTISDFSDLSRTPSWLTPFLTQETITCGNLRRPNPFRSILTSTQGTSLQIGGNFATLFTCSASDEAYPEPSVKLTYEHPDIVNVELPQHSAHTNSPIMLSIQYQLHHGSTHSTISEVMEQRNEHVKTFYSKLWFGNDTDCDVKIDSVFRGEEVELTRKLLQDLESTISMSFNDSDAFFPGSDILPISVGIVVAWDTITKPIVLNGIDGDLLRLVHHSNTFRYRDEASPLRVGDVVSTTSSVKAIRIEEAGKSVVVEAQVLRRGQHVMDVTSTFLFKGSFDDFTSTFEKSVEPEKLLQVDSSLDEAVLKDRAWFTLHDLSLKLIGKTLLFRLTTNVTWKDTRTFATLQTTGTVFEKFATGEIQELGTVDFSCGQCVGNPVMDFLERKGLPATSVSELKQPGWFGQSSLSVQLPVSNAMYSQVSKDYNPIHTSPVFAAWAELPGTLTHGMHTSAIAAAVLEYLATDGDRLRIRHFSANFTGMVLPQDRLSISVRHTSMLNGKMGFEISAINQDTEEKVLEAQAEVEQVPTTYVFTGQGSQAEGMGMELYSSSAVARKVWDEVDEHLSQTYGWSIINIVKTNPKRLIVHFGGKRGRRIRENYLAMSLETTLPNGTIVKKPALSGLTRQSTSYTFAEPRGLLFSTQFAQPAILLLQKATFEDMKAHGLVQEKAAFAGHSLGEYGALSAFSNFLPIKDLMDVVFYRGLIMQQSMERDEFGETNFSMVAANPQRVGKDFGEPALHYVVKMIANQTNELLEIVNYNVEGEQYVCAGTILSLYILSALLDHLSQSPSSTHTVLTTNPDSPPTDLISALAEIIAQTSAHKGALTLSRGKATIPLKGIDVPFHSTHLRPGVSSYRQFLTQRITERNLRADHLVGKFIPNVMATPFSLEKKYVKEAWRVTGSPVLEGILAEMETGVQG